jgi:cleavage stimulation factor subunit 3
MASEESSWGGEDYSVRDGGAQTQHSDQQVENFAQDSHSSGDAADNGSEDDGGDYDPESVLLESSHPVPPNKSSSSPNSNQQRSVSKPKMTGGFLVEASDEEEDEDETPGNSAQPGQSLRVPEQAEEPSNSNTGAQGAANTAPAPNGFPGIAGLDPVALLEARIKEDPRGDMDAWLNLIADHKRRNHIEALRNTYERFLDVFPQAADIWTDWIELELSLDQFPTAERIFGRCLMSVPNVRLWTVYLNYIRRRNDLTKDDPSGQARRTVASSYEFVIDNIGVDRDSGTIWQDYIQFVKSAPGQIGGNGWQDQQKMDLVRKAFHRAIAVPMSTVNNLWKEYDQFEMGLNKLSVSHHGAAFDLRLALLTYP